MPGWAHSYYHKKGQGPPASPPAPAAHSALLQDWLLLRSSSCCKIPVLLQYFLLLHRILNPPTRAAAAFACKNVLYSPSPPVPPLPHTFKPCRWSSTSRRGDPALRPAREPASARTPCLGRATCRRFADSFRADDDHSGNTGSPAFITTPNLAPSTFGQAPFLCKHRFVAEKPLPFCCERPYRQKMLAGYRQRAAEGALRKLCET